jgi:hypothetical protein
MIAALAAAAALCAATPVHAAPFPGVEPGLAQLTWVQAGTKRARITGFLFGYDRRLVEERAPRFALWANGAAPEGWATKVLWRIPVGRGERELVIRGTSLDGGGTFEQRSLRAGGGAGYPSIVDLPSAGCWRLDVRTGGVKARFVVKAVAP